jgi:F0F1-type ATP synthase membrane subunit b/b'
MFSSWIAKIGAAFAAIAGVILLIMKGRRDAAKKAVKTLKQDIEIKTQKVKAKQRERTDQARAEAKQEAEQAQEQVDEHIEKADAGERPTGSFGDPRLHDD